MLRTFVLLQADTKKEMKITLTIPATAICLIIWLLQGVPFNYSWGIAFTFCIGIDIFVHIGKSEKSS